MWLDEWADERVRPDAALVVAVAAVSTSAILIRLSEAPGVVDAFYRVVFMAALVAPVAVSRHPEDLRGLSRRDGLLAVGAGAALAVHFAAWFVSLRYTSVAASVTLVQSQPVFVAVGAAAFLAEPVDRRTVAGILVAVAGAAAMSLADPGAAVPVAGRAALGNGLAVLGAAAFAAYSLVGRSLRQRVALFPYVAVVYAVAAVGLAVLAVAWSLAVGAGDPVATLFVHPATDWLLFVAMAVGPGLFGHTVINWALAHLRSSLVSVSLLGEPVGSTLLAVALLGAVPTLGTVAGGAVVLAGIYVTSTGTAAA